MNVNDYATFAAAFERLRNAAAELFRKRASCNPDLRSAFPVEVTFSPTSCTVEYRHCGKSSCDEYGKMDIDPDDLFSFAAELERLAGSSSTNK